MKVRLVGGLAVAAAAAACAVQRPPDLQGTSAIEILPPPPQQPLPEGYKPKFRSPESPPEALERPLPVYPESLVPLEIGCSARLLYHIQTDGSVTLVRLEWLEPPPTDHRNRFEEAIREAMAGWAYVPGVQYVPTKLPDGKTTTVRRRIPKAERAIIRFRVIEGEPVVESSEADGA